MKADVASDWARVLLVCGKCSKKVGRAFGEDGDRTLAKALRAELGVGKGRKAAAGVVEVKCLGLCPKGAVVVMDGAAPGRWVLVKPGTPKAKMLAALGEEPASPTSVYPELVEGLPFLSSKGRASTSSA
ncbi:hypothetical protein [uncultured Sphingomonas sp.]|uniref:hypothetical protein n=1 Tax=uncultured Sphingomonas sp. TaxID=158754 RepID=UPI0035CBDBB6